MRIVITGATGFIGRALTMRLLRDGHSVIAWTRDVNNARALLGGEPEIYSGDSDSLKRLVAESDAVVNLAGAPVLGKRWSDSYRAKILNSRVSLTDTLVEAIKEASKPPKTFVSASAIGYYGPQGDDVLTETSPAGSDFLSDVCQAWEASANKAAKRTRVCCMRIGLVLGLSGGALEKMLPLFRKGLGGRMGQGNQFMSWIHLHDVVEAIATALTDQRYEGPINLVGPSPVTNREFTKALASALGKPAFLPVPKFALRLGVGEGVAAVLASQRVMPAKLRELGFEFTYDSLSRAINDCLPSSAGVSFGSVDETPAGSYCAKRRPRYTLSVEQTVPLSLEETFSFFADARNLAAITPPQLSFAIAGDLPPMETGALIDYRIKLGFIPLTWRTEITQWRPGEKFVDAQLKGPYRAWWHEHRFEAVPGGTRIIDTVYYKPPLWLLGRLANWLFIRQQLREIFAFRVHSIQLRMGRKAQAAVAHTAPTRNSVAASTTSEVAAR